MSSVQNCLDILLRESRATNRNVPSKDFGDNYGHRSTKSNFLNDKQQRNRSKSTNNRNRSNSTNNRYRSKSKTASGEKTETPSKKFMVQLPQNYVPYTDMELVVSAIVAKNNTGSDAVKEDLPLVSSGASDGDKKDLPLASSGASDGGMKESVIPQSAALDAVKRIYTNGIAVYKNLLFEKNENNKLVAEMERMKIEMAIMQKDMDEMKFTNNMLIKQQKSRSKSRGGNQPRY